MTQEEKELYNAANAYAFGLDCGDLNTNRDTFVAGAEWQKEQFEKERLKHCDELTAEQAQIESDFVTQHLKKNNRIPTYIDAIEYGKQILANSAKTCKPFDYDHASIEQKDFAPKCVNGTFYVSTKDCWRTDKPKFKVSDWIVHNESGFVGQITKIIKFDDGFAYDHTNGYFHGCFEDNYHLWTIKDAKDGDVVVFNNKIYLLKGFMIDDTDDIIGFTYYCDYYDDKLEGGYFLQQIDIETVTPATKKQRDLLFQKMKEAGYTWNPDEKKLEKIEQRSFNYECANIQQKDYALPPQSERKSLQQVFNDMKNDVDYFVRYAEAFVKEQEQKFTCSQKEE